MKFIGIFLVCLYIIQANGMQDDEKKCGEKLTSALNDVCKNGYIGLDLKKRTVSPKFMLPVKENSLRYLDPAGSLADIYELEEESFEENVRRARNLGIVQYCCKRACSLDQLGMYCK